LRRRLDELGLGIHALHTPFNGLHLAHPMRNDAALSRRLIAASIRQAAALGAGLVVVHPSSDPEEFGPELRPVSRQLAQDLVADMVEVAEECGTRVALENNVDRGYWRYGTSLAQLAEDFPDPRIGFCLDVGHAILNGAGPLEEARAAGDRLISIHVASNDGGDDAHYPPDQGLLDWPYTAARLDDLGYRGRFVLETAAHGDADAMLARLSRLWQELP